MKHKLKVCIVALAMASSSAGATFFPTLDVDLGQVDRVGNPYINNPVRVLPGTTALVAFEDWIDDDFDDAFFAVEFSPLHGGILDVDVYMIGALSAWKDWHWGVFADQNNQLVITSLLNQHGHRTFEAADVGGVFTMALWNPIQGVFRWSGLQHSWVNQSPPSGHSETPEPATLGVAGATLLVFSWINKKSLTKKWGRG